MKKILFAALAAATVALPSCSNDETVAVEKGAAIQLNVSSSRISRSNVVTEANITKFHLWANASNLEGTFFINDDATLTDDKWSYGPMQFWPQKPNTVDFIAVYPSDMNVTPHAGMLAKDAKNVFTVNDYVVPGNVDFAYAANYAQEKQTTSVQLNFRHALSQIIFKANNVNKAALKEVKIKGVRVVNVYNKGTFTWATEATNKNHSHSTDDNNGLHTDGLNNGANITYDATWGTWAVAKTEAKTSYANNFINDGEDPTPVSLTDEIVKDLTKTGTDVNTKACTGGLLLLPQEITPWDTKNTETATGSYFAINCQLIDKNGVQLYPATTGAYAEVLIPVPEITWEQGKRYTYIFHFGHGAGWTTGTDPEPVLYGINVTVTVDEFQSVNDKDVDMHVVKGN